MNKKLIKNIFVIGLTLGLAGCAKANNVNSEKTDLSSYVEETKEETVLLKPDIFRLNEPTIPTEIKGHNLSLESSVEIVYYVKNNVEYVDKGLLLWKDNAPKTYTYENAQYRLKSNTTETISEIEYDSYYFDGVAAKEMTTYIYAVSYVYDGANYTYGNPDKYSVLDYCLKYKNSNEKTGGGDKTLGEMVNAILDYGAMTQQYFSYKLNRLATATFYKLTINGGVLDDGFSQCYFTSGEGMQVTPVPPYEYQVLDHWELQYVGKSNTYTQKTDYFKELTGDATIRAIWTNASYTMTVKHVIRDPRFNNKIENINIVDVRYDYEYKLDSYILKKDGLRFVKYTTDDDAPFDTNGRYTLTHDSTIFGWYDCIKITYNLNVDDNYSVSTNSVSIDMLTDLTGFRLPVPHGMSGEGAPKQFAGWYNGDTKFTDESGSLLQNNPLAGVYNVADITINLTAMFVS